MPIVLRGTCRVAHPERVTGTQLHGALSNWLEQVIPRDLHAQPQVAGTGWSGGQPYAIGAMRCLPGILGFDIKILIDSLSAPLVEQVRAAAGTGHFGSGAHREVFELEQHEDGDYLEAGAHTDFYDLLERPRESWTIEMRSLTTWRNRGTYLPDPTPERVFTSLLNRWRAYAPPDLREVGGVTVADLEIHEIGRSLVDATDRQHHGVTQGVTGTVEHRSLTSDPMLRELTGALLGFLPYCGLGYHTTHGFGDAWVR